jgi:hypothetical protein
MTFKEIKDTQQADNFMLTQLGLALLSCIVTLLLSINRLSSEKDKSLLDGLTFGIINTAAALLSWLILLLFTDK